MGVSKTRSTKPYHGLLNVKYGLGYIDNYDDQSPCGETLYDVTLQKEDTEYHKIKFHEEKLKM